MLPIKQRLLDPKDIPASLWHASSQTMFLPQPLVIAYNRIIDRYSLRQLAESRGADDSPIGGLTKEQADQHFSQAFGSSVARTQLAFLDPKQAASDASNAFVSCLAGNNLSLTDAPCGAGASAFAFLTTVAELRAHNILPRQPLHVNLIGAELSSYARTYAQEVLNEIIPVLEAQAIFVTAQFHEWDVTRPLSNTDLIRQMILASANDNQKRLLVVANFSGFLERSGKRKEAEPQFEELFRHSSGPNSIAIWIEPDMNIATSQGGLFSWLTNLIRSKWRNFVKTHAADLPKAMATSSTIFQLPLNPDKTAMVRLAVMALNLVREND